MLKQQKLVSQAEVLLEQQVVVKPGDAGDGCTSGGQVVWAPVQPYQSGKSGLRAPVVHKTAPALKAGRWSYRCIAGGCCWPAGCRASRRLSSRCW